VSANGLKMLRGDKGNVALVFVARSLTDWRKTLHCQRTPGVPHPSLSPTRWLHLADWQEPAWILLWSVAMVGTEVEVVAL
jgi:hypothetical protein